MKPSIGDLIEEIEVAQEKKLLEAKYLHSLICVTLPVSYSYTDVESQLKKAVAIREYIKKTYFDVTKVYCYTRDYPRSVEIFICHDSI